MTEEQLMDDYYYHCDATYTEAPNQESPVTEQINQKDYTLKFMNKEYDLPMNIIIPSVGEAILVLIVVIIVISSKCCKLKKCRKIQQEDINNFNEL